MNLRDKILALLDDKGELTSTDIANILREDAEDVELTLKGMEREGLIYEKQKGIFFKKKVYNLTPTGLEKAKNIKQDLQNKANNIVSAIQRGEDPQVIYQEYGDVLPLIMEMSLIDMMILESLLMFDLFDTL